MPKKQPRNAYYYYMMDFKEQQRKKGIHYQNMMEVQQAADPSWRSAPPSLRAKFEQIAKAEKEKLKGSNQKFTSNGTPISLIEARKEMEREMEETELEYIKHFVRMKGVSNGIFGADIYLIDVNMYCSVGDHYLIGESTVLRFNLADGIQDSYHELINPGRIPIGYVSDVKIGAQELGLNMPEEEAEKTDFMIVLANIMDYLKQNQGSGHLPPLYTLPDKVGQVKDYILQLCINAEEDESQIRVYKLDSLFYHITNEIATREEEGFPKLSLATGLLKKDAFKYTPKLACEHHEAIDKSVECTSSRVKRWAFAVLDKCCPVGGVLPVPGRHVPHGVDIESVLTYKEQKKEEGAMYRNIRDDTSNFSCSSTVVSGFADSVIGSEKSRQQRILYPLRMPTDETLRSETIAPAPELKDDEVISLAPVAGVGRGRGMVRSMKKLSLNK